MMRRLVCMLTAVALLTSGMGRATAGVITFESAPPGDFPSYTEQGVTFTPVGGELMTADDYGPTPNGTRGLIGVSMPFPELRADISGGARSVSVDLGDFDSDPDLLFLEIYNSSNVLLGSTTLLIDGSFTGMETLTLSDPAIAYAIFGSRPPSVNGSSVFADNFAFTPAVEAVPEPSTYVLLSLGTLALLVYGWRQRRKRAAA